MATNPQSTPDVTTQEGLESILPEILPAQGEVEYGVFGRGTTATSVLLEGFVLEVDAVLNAA